MLTAQIPALNIIRAFSQAEVPTDNGSMWFRQLQAGPKRWRVLATVLEKLNHCAARLGELSNFEFKAEPGIVCNFRISLTASMGIAGVRHKDRIPVEFA